MTRASVIAVLQARMSSSRLPGKVLLQVCGKPLLQHQIERVRRCAAIDQLIVATSSDSSDDLIEILGRSIQVPVYRGSREDVLDRFVSASRPYRCELVVRLTGDCPLVDPAIVDRVVQTTIDGGFDYVSSALHPSFPDGLDAECLRFETLEQAWREAALPSEREHVTSFVYARPGRFRLGEVRNDRDLSSLRWTVDEPRDFVFVSQVYERLYPGKPDFSMEDVLQLLDNEPALSLLNGGIARNEGYIRSLQRDAAAGANNHQGGT